MDGRIRRYIRAKQKLTKLLDEQKQAIVDRAVVRGIDPNDRLKPSGVEWLGEVPEHWKIIRSKRVFKPRTELAHLDDVQLSATQAYGVIAQEEYEQRVGRKIVRIFQHLDKRRHVEIDDFVISMRSFQGGLERAWARGCIRSSYVVLKPVREVSVPYFARLFKSSRYIRAIQATANFIRDGQDLNYGNFCAVDLPWPPLGEQKQIAGVLEEQLAACASTAEKASREIALLREYRTRLIADVVTGKLDVREAAAQLPNEAKEPTPTDETETVDQEDGDDNFETNEELEAIEA
jgi:type I restriction enzyme S subunit